MAGEPRSAARDWGLLAVATLVVFTTIPFAPPWIDWVRQRGLLWLSVAVCFAAAGLLAGWQVLRGSEPVRAAGPRLVLAALGALYVWLLLESRYPEEALHLIEYGVLGGLAWRAVGWHATGLLRAAIAVAVAGALGWLEELIQWFTPGRVYDGYDVLLNLVGGMLAIAGVAVAHSAREAARRRGDPVG